MRIELTVKDTRKGKFVDPDAALESNDRLRKVLARRGLTENTWARRRNPLSSDQIEYVEEPLKPERPGFIYFIRAGDGGDIKIGHAHNVERRLKNLQVAQADHLQVLLTIPGDRSFEKRLHRKFSRSHIRGEWFRPTKALLRFIELGSVDD